MTTKEIRATIKHHEKEIKKLNHEITKHKNEIERLQDVECAHKRTKTYTEYDGFRGTFCIDCGKDVL